MPKPIKYQLQSLPVSPKIAHTRQTPSFYQAALQLTNLTDSPLPKNLKNELVIEALWNEKYSMMERFKSSESNYRTHKIPK